MTKRSTVFAALAAVLVVAGGTGAVWLLRRGSPPVDARDSYKWVEVTRVRDGDSVKLDEGDEKVDYAGIRAPIGDEPQAESAAKRNRELVEGRKVRLRFDQADRTKDGHVLAYVFSNDEFVNLRLVREGLAWVRLTPETQLYSKDLLAAQLAARRDKRGVWSSPPPKPEPEYKADSKYGTFHRGSCEETPKIKLERVQSYASRDDAVSHGMAPCHKCRP